MAGMFACESGPRADRRHGRGSQTYEQVAGLNGHGLESSSGLTALLASNEGEKVQGVPDRIETKEAPLSRQEREAGVEQAAKGSRQWESWERGYPDFGPGGDMDTGTYGGRTGHSDSPRFVPDDYIPQHLLLPGGGNKGNTGAPGLEESSTRSKYGSTTGWSSLRRVYRDQHGDEVDERRGRDGGARVVDGWDDSGPPVHKLLLEHIEDGEQNPNDRDLRQTYQDPEADKEGSPQVTSSVSPGKIQAEQSIHIQRLNRISECHPNFVTCLLSKSVQVAYKSLGVMVREGGYLLNTDIMSTLVAGQCGRWVELSSEGDKYRILFAEYEEGCMVMTTRAHEDFYYRTLWEDC